MSRALRTILAVALTAAVFSAACRSGTGSSGGQSSPSGGGSSSQASPAATATGFPTAAEKAMYQQLKSDFDSSILPAAKKEGQITWYTCLTTEDAQAVISGFNKAYPQINVNYVYMVPNDAFQRVTAEETAKHVVGDFYSCGGTTSRNLDFAGLYSAECRRSAGELLV
jgi:ABC-type glycerol-3-phosphate transport system substrate-binding protein